MNETKELQQTDLNQALDGLPRFPITKLVNKISSISTEVIKRGATVITNHNAPTMVLMSVERYVQLEKAARPNLDSLTKEFDALYAQMQKPGVAEKTTTALDLDR